MSVGPDGAPTVTRVVVVGVSASYAAIVTDMLNPYEHADADRLAESVEQSLPAIERLIDRAKDADALTVSS